jgi:hypothetical protein
LLFFPYWWRKRVFKRIFAEWHTLKKIVETMNRDPEVTAKLQVHPEATSRKEDPLLPIEAIKNLMATDQKEEILNLLETANLTEIDLKEEHLRTDLNANLTETDLLRTVENVNLTVTDLNEEHLQTDLNALRLRSGTEAIKNLMVKEVKENLTEIDLHRTVENANLTETDQNLMSVDHLILLDQ